MELHFRDISAEKFGKYQFCTTNKRDGLAYADCDFRIGGGLKKGALPSPMQDTEEKRERAKQMREKAAQKSSMWFFWS